MLTRGMMSSLPPTRLIAALLLSSRGRKAAFGFMGRPFPARARLRLAIYCDPNRITFAQIFPFLQHAADLRDRHGVELRVYSIDHLCEAQQLEPADVVLVAPWFTIDRDRLARGLDRLAACTPEGGISFIDSYAHNDLRLASLLDGRIRYYFKKSLFKDRRRFLQRHQGTELQDYYGRLYGISHPLSDWHVPEAFLTTLRLSPGFFHSNHLFPRFRSPSPPLARPRHFDLHIRLETHGTPWYSAMREDALRRALALGLRTTGHDWVDSRLYTSEMETSRLCFSPFGYGELCWRDSEAIAAGAVLIKPDMSHLDTLPDRFEPGVTYMPVKWDFSDLEEVTTRLLADPDLCESIARTAYDRIASYIRDKRFLEASDCLFVDFQTRPG